MKSNAIMRCAISLCPVFLVATVLLTSCGGGGASSVASTTTSSSGSGSSTANAYATAYKSATWASGVTVTFSSSCSMTVSATGVPPTHSAYYLAPVTTGQTIVATTASGIQLGVVAYSSLASPLPINATFDICPAKASTTTTTSMGAIGILTSGEALFNAYEATGTVATGDNASYAFTQAGVSYTASFIDSCDSHAAGNMGSSSWHYHGNPVCWTPTVDGTGASHIIGIALDGFPIYGGRDINGAVIDPASLDPCNGITSATPEFPAGAYHYVLPVDSKGAPLTTRQSSVGCYAGTANASLIAAMKRLACKMPMLLASGKLRLPDGREVDNKTAQEWASTNMPAPPSQSAKQTRKLLLTASSSGAWSPDHQM